MLLATTVLTLLAVIVVGGGGIAGWWGAFVAMRSDRRLREFLDEQANGIAAAIEDGDGDG